MSFQTAQMSQSQGLRRNNSSSSDEDGFAIEYTNHLQEIDDEVAQTRDEQIINLDAAAAPANPQNPPLNGAGELERSDIARKIGFIWSLAIIIYLAVFSIAYIAVLRSEWSLSCNRRLHMWSAIQVTIQILMVLIKSKLLHFVTKNVPSFENMEPTIIRSLSLHFFVNRLGNFAWLSWWVVGTVLRFGNAACATKSLMSLILVQFIIQWSLVGLIFLGICCVGGITIILWCCFPGILQTGEQIRGATPAQIRKLPEEKYDPSSSKVKVEDATCAICLSPYETNDMLRHLPCNHHFHTECIDQWLVKNKSCPFCKRQIDQENTTTTTDASSSTNLNIDTENDQNESHPFDDHEIDLSNIEIQVAEDEDHEHEEIPLNRRNHDLNVV